MEPAIADDADLQAVFKKPAMSTEEASRLLLKAQVPGLIIESILQLGEGSENKQD